MVRRLRSAAAGEPDATERRDCGASRSPGLGDAAAGAAGCCGGDAGAAGGQGRGLPGGGGRDEPGQVPAVGPQAAGEDPSGAPGPRRGWCTSASPAGSRFLSIRSRRGCSMRWPGGPSRWGLGAVADRGDRRRSGGVGCDGRCAGGLCPAGHRGHDGTCRHRAGHRSNAVPAGAHLPAVAGEWARSSARVPALPGCGGR